MNARQRRVFRRKVMREFPVGMQLVLRDSLAACQSLARGVAVPTIWVVTESDPRHSMMWGRCVHILPEVGGRSLGRCVLPSELIPADSDEVREVWRLP